MTEGTWYAVVFAIFAILGVRGSIRLARRYRDVRGQLIQRERLLLLSIVVVAWAIAGAALYFGFLAVRVVLGFERIPQLAPVSALIATAILLIPAFLDWVVEHVARVPWR